MKRTTAANHSSNLYQAGNPASGLKPTTLGTEEMNNIQEEICNVVEAAGITLDGATMNQMLAAINVLIKGGGSAPIEFTVANNTSVAANVTGLLFNSTNVKGAKIVFDLHRKTDSAGADQTGEILLTHTGSAWRIAVNSNFDDAGVTFSVTSGGQVQYVSTNMAGGSYVGTLRAKIIEHAQ